MKSMIATLAVALMGLTAAAQTQAPTREQRAFRFGVMAGANISTAFAGAGSSTFKPGYQAGLAFDYAFSQKFLLQSELSFIDKGSKLHNFMSNNYVGGTPDWTDIIDQQYVALSLFATRRVTLSRGWDFLYGAGPYFAYGVGGKDRHTLNNGVYGDGTNELTYKTFETTWFSYTDPYLGVYTMPEDAILRRFDFGLGLRAGVEYRRISLSLGFDQGLINIAVNRDYLYINSCLSLSAGYKF